MKSLHEQAAEIVSRHKEWTQELTKTDYRDERIFVYQQIREVADDMAALIAAMDARLKEIAKELGWGRDLWRKAEDSPGVVLFNANGFEIAKWIDRVDAARKEAAGE